MMLPFAQPGAEVKKVLHGRTFLLSPMTGERGIDWAMATVEDGKALAKAMGDKAISRETIESLVMRGIERAALALGCDLEFAAELSEAERFDVIKAQDELNQTHVIEPFLNVQQAAARAYLGEDVSG